MQPNNYVIAEDDLSIDKSIETELLRSLRAQSQQSLNSKFVFSCRDESAQLVGGVSASTSYGWMLIELIWVSEQARGLGIGRTLMQHAEDKARSLNCHAAWLETSSPKAKTLYARLGFKVFGELCNTAEQFPPAHQRWFMKKNL